MHTIGGDDTHDALALAGAPQYEVVHRLGNDVEIGLAFQHLPDGGFVKGAIRLGAGGANRRAFADIQHPELDASTVSGTGHSPTERVHLPDKMAFANAADSRVAGHLA